MNYTQRDQQLRKEFIKLNKKASYGTAGFRDLATNMPYIVFRVGALVTLINQTQPNKHLGIVISASHNKKEDNGVKITNFKGNMLQKDIEPKVEQFVNEESLEEAVSNFKSFLLKRGLTVYQAPVTVFIGGDTRPSTQPFLDIITEGIKSQGGNALNFHLTTTPQLQFYVYLANVVLKHQIKDPQQIRTQFWKVFSQYFIKSADYLGWTQQIKRTIDCANGVGAHAMPQFNKLINKYIQAELVNTSDNDYLNKQSGADYVKTNKLFPRNFNPKAHNSYVSFDGDADRIIFYTQLNGKLNLIDGDRTGTVLTQFFNRISSQIRQKTQKLNKSGELLLNIPVNPKIGFVQTYYANYSSSEYLKQTFGMDPVFAATGVKNLHEKAEHYDIGIYFEGNGHGTVIFNEEYLEKLDALLNTQQFLLESPAVTQKPQLKQQLQAYLKYLEFYVSICKLSNPSVGDAICVFLLFELALFYLKKNYSDTLALYKDLQSLTSKIAVNYKQKLKVNDIEDKVVEPEGLQAKIEEILKKHKGKKAFLRASGTENVLRLHVQAESQGQVQAITVQIGELVAKDTILN